MSEFALLSEPPAKVRGLYLSCLAEPQEWFLEELVGLGDVWAHADGTYGVIQDGTLVEFVSADRAQPGRRLRALHDALGFRAALVKSFDLDLVGACEALGWRSVVGGFLFRKRRGQGQATFNCAELRAGTSADVPAIWRINDVFFETRKEVAVLAASGRLWTATVDGQIAGCGIAQVVIKGGDAVDVGMMVAPEFRRKGLGSYIVQELANRLERDGLRPICGCGASNVASRRALETAGFVTEYQLLRFAP